MIINTESDRYCRECEINLEPHAKAIDTQKTEKLEMLNIIF